MSNKSGSRNLKRMASPKTWRLPRKQNVWVARPKPGAHPANYAMPLTLAVRMLEKAATSREAEKLAKSGEVHVDGKARRDPCFAIGFMDVVYFPTTKEAFRVVFDQQGKITFKPEKNKGVKLCRVERKTTAKGGKTQLGMHDGRTLFAEGDYKLGDVLKISVPDQKVMQKIRMAEKSLVCIIRGKYTGRTGRVTKLEKTAVQVETEDGAFTTLASYAFAIGDEKPEVTV